MTSKFTLAIAQTNPQRLQVAKNLAAIQRGIEEAARQGAQLVIFPECALSGYVFDSAAEALPAAITVPGSEIDALCAACERANVYAIVGLLELTGDSVYNSAAVVGPHGLVANYRKCHLPVLGIDRFASKGDSLCVVDLPFARIGILICYDVRFPEAARSLTLQGADLIAVPTNWPAGAESAPEFLTRARAWENRVYVAACNRVGVEQGVRFIGRSQIVSPDGVIRAEADGESECLLLGEIDPQLARQKRLIIEPGVFELDPVGGRRPDLYGALLS